MYKRQIQADLGGGGIAFLNGGLPIDPGNVDLLTYNGDAISIELPLTMALKIVQTDPGFKGDTASGATKPAILETGLKISVPLFISEGEMVKVDTRSGEYLERADK